jgi:hypothetical protein
VRQGQELEQRRVVGRDRPRDHPAAIRPR